MNCVNWYNSSIRIIDQDEDAIAFVPVCARYPYEVWIAQIQPVSSFAQVTPEQPWGLAKA
jgi:UDPglucose--hexose-1-phosphate uridylyltransferase